jgi:hypothetical protein
MAMNACTWVNLQKRSYNMNDDERCCGTGTCIIDAQGKCWCGQQWDGEKMCRPVSAGPNGAQTEDDAVSPLIPKE